MFDSIMLNKIKPIRFLIIAISLFVFSWSANADDTWLDWFNRGVFSFNNGVSDNLTGMANVLPALPQEVKHGLRNLAVTWVNEPLNAGAHLIAGRTEDAGVALHRMVVNISRGWLGFVDRAAEEGMVTTPIDYGLALCTRGVPAGSFIVVPFMGVRTVRDFASDWVAAHVVLYSVLFGVIGMPITFQNLVWVEAVEEVITLSIGGEIGEMPEDAKVKDLNIAKQNYLAGRERSCAELSNGSMIKPQ
ncbi:VacJ family lipoprotein [Gammaproteobacteria bacterium]